MAYQKNRLIEWATKHKSKLKLELTRFNYLSKYCPKYHDFKAEITWMGKVFTGRGTDLCQIVALEKSISEAIERASFDGNKKLTGHGAHYSQKKSKICAYNELLEVDRALCHHYTKTPFYELDHYHIGNEASRLIKNLSKQLPKKILKLYEMRPSLDATVSIAILSNRSSTSNNQGFICGFGSNQNRNKSHIKAIIECIRDSIPCLYRYDHFDQNLEKLKKSGDPQWHFYMTQNIEALNYLNTNLISKKNYHTRESVSIEDVDFQENINFKIEFPDIPIFLFTAESKKLIEPKFGEIIIKDRDIKRFSDFDPNYIFSKIETPHFYG